MVQHTVALSPPRGALCVLPKSVSLLLLTSLYMKQEALDTGGGRVLLPRCNLWSCGHAALRRWTCSVIRSACGVCVCQETKTKTKKTKENKM